MTLVRHVHVDQRHFGMLIDERTEIGRGKQRPCVDGTRRDRWRRRFVGSGTAEGGESDERDRCRNQWAQTTAAWRIRHAVVEYLAMSATTLHLVSRPAAHRRISAIAAVLLALGVSVVGHGIARAHTGFESSTPSAGAAIDEPVELVTIVFTGEAIPVGDEFVALTADGVLQEPAVVETLDNKLFSIRFDPPLTGGQVGIRWNVQAADAHPIEGAFSFTVNAPAATTVPPTTAPVTAVEPAPTSAPVAEAEAVPPTTDDSAAVVVSDEAEPSAAAEPTAETAGAAAATQAPSLDEFLAVDNSAPGETTATVGRLVGFLGVALGLGALAFVATALARPP